MDFEVKSVDTHNAVLGAGSGIKATGGSGWRFIVPVSGIYLIGSEVTFASATVPVANQMFVLVYVDGALMAQGNMMRGIGDFMEFTANVHYMVQLNAGSRVESCLILCRFKFSLRLHKRPGSTSRSCDHRTTNDLYGFEESEHSSETLATDCQTVGRCSNSTARYLPHGCMETDLVLRLCRNGI